MGEEALKCSFTLSPKNLPDCPMYALEAVYVGALVMVNNPCLVVFGVLVLWVA